MNATYQIQDEPARTGGGAFIVNPFWPLLALMLAGAWLCAALFISNAWLLRGPTWRREILLAAGMLLGSVVLFAALAWAASAGPLPERALKYAFVSIIALKLGIAYWIFFLQQNPFALHEYFRGHAQTQPVGAALVVGGAVLKGAVVKAFATPLWQVMVS